VGGTAFDPAWALRPEALEVVVGLVQGGRTNVVECGSGLSTVTIAAALRALDAGRIDSLEHSPEWASVTRASLAQDGLDRFATVIDAPLRDGWYDTAALGALPERDIDLLLVDGPLAGDPGLERSRYPALPALADRLAPGAAIVLDDIDRDGERWVFERWREEHDLRPLPRPPGVALARYVAPVRDVRANDSERKV
jgi:predicted O-methyltransferase YrrM